MEYIIVFIITITISIMFTEILKRKIDEVIPITIICMTLLVYITGIFDNLKIGVYILLIIFFISLIYNIILTVKRGKNIDFDNILTPGLFIYTIIYIIYIFINKNKIFTHYDEFSHWGLIVKNMYIFNNFGLNAESFIQYCEYPPFMAVFQYIFLTIKGRYSEATIITASRIMYISIIIPVLKNITWKSDKKIILIYFISIIFLPMLFFENFYDNILVDGIASVFFGRALYSYYSVKDEKFRKITIILLLIALGLIKSSGIGLTLLVMMIMLIDALINIKNKRELIRMALIILIVLIFILTWYIKIDISNA